MTVATNPAATNQTAVNLRCPLRSWQTAKSVGLLTGFSPFSFDSLKLRRSAI